MRTKKDSSEAAEREWCSQFRGCRISSCNSRNAPVHRDGKPSLRRPFLRPSNDLASASAPYDDRVGGSKSRRTCRLMSHCLAASEAIPAERQSAKWLRLVSSVTNYHSQTQPSRAVFLTSLT